MSTDTITSDAPAETAENVETPETNEPEAPAFDVSVLDETDQLLFAKNVKAINLYNEKETERRSLSGDVNEVTASVLESNDPEIVDLKAKVESAQKTLANRQATLDEVAKKIANEKIAQNTDTAKVEKLTAESASLLKRIKATISALVVDYPEIKTAFPSLVSNKSAGAGTGKGAGVARPRNFTVSVNGTVAKMPNNKKEQVSSFSAASKVIGCDTKELQDAYFASEGSDASAWKVGKAVSFSITHDGKSYAVVATKNPDPVKA